MSGKAGRLYAPLRLAPGASRHILIWLLAIHATAAATTMLLPIPGWLTVGVQLLLAVSLLRAYRIHIAKSAPRAIVEALWDLDGQWLLTLASGDVVEATLRSDSFVSVPLVVLNFKTAPWWRNSSLLLTGDALDKDVLRKLRVRLKLGDGKALSVPT